jgi:phage terminase large subunit-like protein
MPKTLELEPQNLRLKLQELAEINLVLKKRQYLNPLEFYKHLSIQDLFHFCTDKIKGLFGGNRSGKTEEGAEYVIAKCLANPGSRWWACAETFKDSINIQQRKVWNLLPKNEVRYAFYDEVNGFRHRVVIFKNNSRLEFKSYDQKRESFQGDDIDGIWNDEEPPFEIYKEQKMRLIDRDGEMIFTLTALKGVTELINEIFEDHEVLRMDHSKILDEDLPRIIRKAGMTFFMLWTTENPHINQRRLSEDIKLMSRGEIKSRIHGIPTNLAGRIYPQMNRQVHVVTAEELPTRLVTIYHVLDPHDRKPWAMQWWLVTKTGKKYCVREYPWKKNFNEMESDDKTYEEYATVIRDTEQELFSIYGRTVHKRIIDPNFGNATVQLAKRIDGSSKTTPVKALRRLGFDFKDGNDSVEAGHLAVRKALNWREKDGEIVLQPDMFFLDECENSIRHHLRYSHKDLQSSDGDDRAKPQVTQKFKDFCDCTRYFEMDNPQYVERKPHGQELKERRY